MTAESSSKVLRDFIYLDKDRMYSLYSQLFDGVVETMVRGISREMESVKHERKLEETIIDASTKVQNVVLFDHIYNSLEEKMASELTVVSQETQITDIKPDSIIKVTGFARIEDYDYFLHLMKNFNDIGRSFATIKLRGENKDKVYSKNEIDRYAKDNHLYLEKQFTDSLTKIIEELHGPSMEILIPIVVGEEKIRFRAFLDERFFRIPQDSIKSVYGYLPCMKWTIVGEVTNLSFQDNNTAKETSGMLADMFNNMETLNHAFTGLTDPEKTVRLAPIAIYIEHEFSTLESGEV